MQNIVYTTSGCPFCVMAKALLTDLGIEFEERLLKDRAEFERMKLEYNWRTVPMVVLRGKFIGGYDETRALADAGKLEEYRGKS